jgi:exopolysaccharide biosynthesis polyprenyl glycosylphosphotransferase
MHIRRRWQRRYVVSLVVGDALCALVAAAVGLQVRFPGGEFLRGPQLDVVLVAAVLPGVWVLGMFANRTYERRFLWVGAEEFRRVTTAGVWVIAGVASASWAMKWELSRGFMVVALPLAIVLTFFWRYNRRRILHKQRNRGLYQQRALVVGHRSGVTALRDLTDASRYHGLHVVGCCIPEPQAAAHGLVDEVPVLGSIDDILDVVRGHDIEVVAVLPSPELDGSALRRLGWELEGTEAELMLAPAVTEIAGPRVAIRPVAGLPLLHVERPELTGIRGLVKTAVDVIGALVGLVVFSPAVLVIGLAIKVTSRGPVLYKQERVGRDGETFHMLKFRSMVVDADQRLAELRTLSDGNDVLFKMKRDPRVTRVGRIIRRYSLDELPQLINVLRGQMSLVGPRPPLSHETDRYGFDMHRRFVVKPGMTGLWQISGRSDLSWDDSVRIDVRYVENWSFGLDMFILWKTLGAVRNGAGAY